MSESNGESARNRPRQGEAEGRSRVADSFGRANSKANAEELVTLIFASWNQAAALLRGVAALQDAG